MDLTTTAAVANTATAATQAGFTPAQLAMMMGPVIAHAIQPIAAKIPASLKPTLIAAGAIAVGAFTTSVQTGMSFKQALGYGIGTALSAKLYHLGVLKDGGVIGSVMQGMNQPKA